MNKDVKTFEIGRALTMASRLYQKAAHSRSVFMYKVAIAAADAILSVVQAEGVVDVQVCPETCSLSWKEKDHE